MPAEQIALLTDKETAATSIGFVEADTAEDASSFSTPEIEVHLPVFPLSHQPTEASLYLTPACNLSCSYCYIVPFLNSAAKHKKPTTLTTSQWQKIIKDLHANGVRYLKFIGGEPFLRSDLGELIQFADDCSFPGIEIATNAAYSILSKNTKALDIYSDVNAKTLFSTSLDSTRISYHDGIRGGYDDVCRGIKFLIDYGFAVSVATVLTKQNHQDAEDLLALAIDLGVKVYQFGTLVPMFPEQREMVILDKPTILQVCERIVELQRKFGDQITIVNRMVPGANLKPSLYAQYQEVPLFSESSLCGCPAGTREVYVLPDGRLIACPMFMQQADWFTKHSIAERPFEEIWTTDASITKFRAMVATPELHGGCQTCSFGKSCKGGCRAMTYFNLGTFDEKDPRCLY